MSVHFNSTWLNFVPLAVLGASLLGSAHCAGMCGGLIMTVARDRKALLRYHLGRLFGYATLGGIAGFLGETILQSSGYAVVSWISTVILAAGFVFLGTKIWMGKSPHLFRLPPQLWQKIAGVGAGTTGILSAFLPCGWLHAFVLGAVATRSPTHGALYLFFFWLGTLPALATGPLLISRFIRPLSRRAPRLSAIFLIAIGIGSLGMKMLPAAESPVGCHCQDKTAKVTPTPHLE